MAIKADQTYLGKITSAAACFSGSGTPGIQIHIECADGNISHTFWLTPKTVARVEKTFTELGVEKEYLRTENAIENIDQTLADKEISFTTVTEEYKGEARIRVQWVNKPRADSNGKTASAVVAKLFAGKKQESEPLPELRDEDVPF